MLLLNTTTVKSMLRRGGVNQMVAADGGAVAVAGEDDDRQLGVCQLDAGGKGNGTAVGGMDGVKIQIARSTAGATDTGRR
jgi:hypothetical protein